MTFITVQLSKLILSNSYQERKTQHTEAFIAELAESILFDNYPDIAKGTRSAGYTDSELLIAKMPVTLYTDTCRIDAVSR